MIFFYVKNAKNSFCFLRVNHEDEKEQHLTKCLIKDIYPKKIANNYNNISF